MAHGLSVQGLCAQHAFTLCGAKSPFAIVFPIVTFVPPSLRSFAEASPGGSFSRVLIVYSSDLL